MSIPITEVIDVTPIVGGAAPQRFSFGGLMGVFEHNITAGRQDGPFATLAEAEDVGYNSVDAPEVNAWLTSVFAQQQGTSEVFVGRKVPDSGGVLEQVWQFDGAGPTFTDETDDANSAAQGDWELFPAAEAVEDYFAVGLPVPFTSLTLDSTGGVQGVDGGALAIAYEYWDGAAWQSLSNVTDGTSMFTAALSSGQEISWDMPENWAPTILDSEEVPLYYVRFRISAGDYSTNPVYSTGVVTADADWPAAMSAIEAAAGAESWYAHTIGSRIEADILAVAAWTEARFHLFIPQSADAAYLAGTAGNVGLQLQAAGYRRTSGALYHAVSSGVPNGYADGSWASRGTGFDLDSPNGRGVWAFKALPGITVDNFTAAQYNNIKAANGNVYGLTKGVPITLPGVLAAGVPFFIDIQTTIDWIKRRIEEDVVAFFASQEVVPYTNAGIQLCVSVVKQRLDRGVLNGHFSGDEGFGPTVTAPDIADVDPDDKQNQILRLQATATFAGAIQKIILPINISFGEAIAA